MFSDLEGNTYVDRVKFSFRTQMKKNRGASYDEPKEIEVCYVRINDIKHATEATSFFRND